MQLELVFLEGPAEAPRGPDEGALGIRSIRRPRSAALDILSRLIAQMLAASSALETSDE